MQNTHYLYISEIFGPTIQGEGATAGHPAIFIRLAGCNLRCDWCDSKYSWEKGEKMDVIDIYKQVRDIGGDCERIVITGGEPLLQQKPLEELCGLLGKYSLELETNGSIKFDKELRHYFHEINCSPKLKSSGNDTELTKEIIDSFPDYATNWKFVIGDETDAYDAYTLVKKFKLDEEGDVYFMPLNNENKEEVVRLAIKYNFRYSPRLQIDIWGNKRGV